MRKTKNTQNTRSRRTVSKTVRTSSKRTNKQPAAHTKRNRSVTAITKVNVPRTAKQYLAMSEAGQEDWTRVAHVISKMRAEGVSLHKASAEFGVNPKTVAKLGRSALKRNANGRYTAKKSDRLLRILVVHIPTGSTEIAVHTSEEASLIGEYSAAVSKFLRTGDKKGLSKFKGMKVKDLTGKTLTLLTDESELRRLGSAGVLVFESLYARTA